MECLGEPSRFFHAGGCRFDLLFAPGASATSAAGTLLVPEGNGDGVPMGAVLQEVWSLQRESLKEMIGGFRRFEGEQSRQQATLTGRLEQLATRVEEARRESPELAKLIDERLAALQTLISTVEKTHDGLVAARGDITATLAAVEGTCSDMAGSRAEIDRTRTVLEGTRSAVDATRTAVDATRDDIAATRQEITSTRQGLESSRAAVEAVQAAILEAREESRRTLQESVAATRRVLGETAEETRAKLEQLVAQNTHTRVLCRR